ncbi:MAG: hypothetical protein ACSNEK_10060 [Parachlamydiaceae bacterium]
MSSITGYNALAGATGLNPSQTNTGFYKQKIPDGYSRASMQQFTPEQMQLFQSLFTHVQPDSYLSKLAGGDQSFFNQLEAPALRQFNELQGNIASRFSGMGSGARQSSGFRNAMTAASSNFAQDLASRRQSLQRQALLDLLGLSESLLQQRPYEQFLVKKPNVWGDIAGKLAGAIPGAITGFMTGGPAGAATGALSSMFNAGGYNALPGLEDQFRTGQAYL